MEGNKKRSFIVDLVVMFRCVKRSIGETRAADEQTEGTEFHSCLTLYDQLASQNP